MIRLIHADVLPPLEQLFAATGARAAAEGEILTWIDLLRQVYPAGCFAAIVEREAPFRRMLRGEAVSISGGPPWDRPLMVDIRDPYEDAS